MRPLLCLLSASLCLSCAKEEPPPPPPPECGNGLLETDETCEGMPLPTGCAPTNCTVLPGYGCTPEPPTPEGETGGGVVEPMEWMSTCEPLDTCGDGVIDPEEACDDANLEVMDGCSGCRVDPLYTCMGEPSVCQTCGDGFRNPGEECDDGELIDQNSAGCENCMVVPGWDCGIDSPSADLCGPVCGDGMWFDTSIAGVTIGFAEGCDDGNLADGDGCDGNCNVEDGFVCESEAPTTSVCFIPEETTSTSGETDTDGSSGTDTGGSSGSGTDTGTTGGSSSSG